MLKKYKRWKWGRDFEKSMRKWRIENGYAKPQPSLIEQYFKKWYKQLNKKWNQKIGMWETCFIVINKVKISKLEVRMLYKDKVYRTFKISII